MTVREDNLAPQAPAGQDGTHSTEEETSVRTLERLHRYGLTLQGFACSAGETGPAPRGWLRWTPALSTAWILAGVVLAWPALLWAFSFVAALGAVTGRHPFDVLYDRGVRLLTGGRELPVNPAPRRFSMAMAAAWSAATGALFWAGEAAAGYGVGSVLVVAGASVSLTHVCLGSWVYRRIVEPLRELAARGG